MPSEMLSNSEPAQLWPGSPTDPGGPSGVARRRRLGVLARPQVRVGLLTLAALAVEVGLARIVLDVELNFFALLAPFFVFTAYRVSGQRGRTAELVASIAVVAAAATVVLANAF